MQLAEQNSGVGSHPELTILSSAHDEEVDWVDSSSWARTTGSGTEDDATEATRTASDRDADEGRRREGGGKAGEVMVFIVVGTTGALRVKSLFYVALTGRCRAAARHKIKKYLRHT